VLCDRFTDSTLAYQGYARKLPWEEVKTLNELATSHLHPDLVIFLDIDPEQGLRRASNPNRFEAEGLGFQTQVRKGYLQARTEDPKRWFTLTHGDVGTLCSTLVEELERRFGNKLACMKIKSPGCSTSTDLPGKKN
jgi:thymidylate kinase